MILMLEVSESFRTIAMENETTLKKEVGAKTIEYKKSAKFDAEMETKIEESPAWVGVRKV